MSLRWSLAQAACADNVISKGGIGQAASLVTVETNAAAYDTPFRNDSGPAAHPWPLRFCVRMDSRQCLVLWENQVTEFPETRDSLLVQVRSPANREAWDQFALIYRPVIYRLARRKGLQDADAQDLAQRVLMAVAVGHRQLGKVERVGAVPSLAAASDTQCDPQCAVAAAAGSRGRRLVGAGAIAGAAER